MHTERKRDIGSVQQDGGRSIVHKSPRVALRGFTLLEVLVALAVIAIGLAAAIRVSATNGANAIYLRDKTFAQYVAANKVTELSLTEPWPATGTKHGRASMGQHEWYWTSKVSNTVDPRIRRLDITVGLDEDHPVASLSAFLPQPPQ